MVMLDNHNMSNGDTQTREQKRLGNAIVGILNVSGLDVISDKTMFTEGLQDYIIKYGIELEKKRIDGVTERFQKELSLLEKGQKSNRRMSLGMAGHILCMAGLANAEIMLDYDKILRKSSEHYKNYHPFKVNDIKTLPMALNFPIAVFDSASRDGDKVILTELQKDDKNFVVAIRAKQEPRKKGLLLDINEITTLFPKEEKGIVKWINEKNGRFYDKEKALNWLGHFLTHPGPPANKELISAAKIIKNFKNKQLSLENFSDLGMFNGWRADGEVYGFTVNGKIYLDPEKLNANTPIHEYTHLWDNALMKANPELWQRGKDLMKQLPMWEEVKHDPAYKTIADNEDLVASEVHSRLAGNHGELYLTSMLGNNRVRGDFFLLVKIRQWLRDAMKFIRDAFTNKWSNKDLRSLTLEEFSKMPLKSLADGFNPTKIATSNVLQARFIGERGAANLDKTNGDTVMMDTLAEAKRMESENEDAKTIKIATGWEKGVDNKWRYEQPDFKYQNPNIRKLNSAIRRQPWHDEYDRLSKLYDSDEDMTEEQERRYKELEHEVNQLAAGLDKSTIFWLDECIDDPTLFKAYPQLKHVEVHLSYDKDSDTKGRFGHNNLTHRQTIEINGALLNTNDEVRSTLAHEVQHAIQHIEGFASGGNEEAAKDAQKQAKEDYYGLRDEVAYDLKGAFGDERIAEKYVSEHYKDFPKYIDSLDDALLPYAQTLFFLENMNEEQKGQWADWLMSQSPEDYLADLKESAAKVHEELRETQNKSGFELYKSLAGEVESRNVQSRLNMTDEERRNTLASETEDLTRDYQVILKSSPRSVNMSEDEFMAVRERARVEAYIYRHEHPKVTISDYHKSTVATFKGVETKDVEHLWSKMKASGKFRSYQSSLSDSEYLIGRHGDIYRKSDHWGKVSSCNWDLKWDNPHHGNITEIGKCNIKDFRPKMLANWEIGYLKAKMEREQRSLPKSITIERGEDGYVVRGEDAQTLSRLLQKHCSQGEAVSSSLLSIPSEEFVETIGKLKEYGVNPVLKISKENIKLDIDEDRDEDVHHAFHR